MEAVNNLTIKDGCFSYGGRNVLDNINIILEKGSMTAVLGPNGAGKTTLLRCIMGFLKWKSGSCTLDGKEVNAIPCRELWKRVAYVPQARNASAAYTVRDMIIMGRSAHIGMLSKPSDKDIRLAEETMERFSLTKISDKDCNAISGGELQMALIARAIVSSPELLILDEPESNLDFKNQLVVLEAMSQLSADGVTCLFNTHYPAHALQRAGKSLLLSADGSALFGSTSEIVTEENISRAFGVRTVIGEVETDEKLYKSITAVGFGGDSTGAKKPDGNRLAVISIIASDNGMAEQINALFHRYSGFLVGRMGMPYRDGGVYIINATVDAPARVISELSDSISMLPHVSVKTTYAEED